MARLFFMPNPLIEPWLPSQGLFVLTVVLAFVGVAAGLWSIREAMVDPTPEESRIHFAFVVASSLLLMPLCHANYFVLLLPLFWALIELRHLGRSGLNPYVGLIATFVYLAMARPFVALSPIPEEYQHGWKSVFVFSNLMAVVTLWLATLIQIHLLSRYRNVQTAPVMPQAADLPRTDEGVLSDTTVPVLN
jgi:hypothetical protein